MSRAVKGKAARLDFFGPLSSIEAHRKDRLHEYIGKRGFSMASGAATSADDHGDSRCLPDADFLDVTKRVRISEVVEQNRVGSAAWFRPDLAKPG